MIKERALKMVRAKLELFVAVLRKRAEEIGPNPNDPVHNAKYEILLEIATQLENFMGKEL